METSNAKTDTTKNPLLPHTQRRNLLILAVVFLILLAGIWIWKTVQLNNFKKQAATEKQQLQDQASKMIINTHQEHLTLLAKPFV
ncbi:hypothetical protein [Adhaeribacter radiodurans]|uniref:Uncharacterized protein n=1 Tax=Adhaeribacter radiodurans TaxID=2745197 RepID=A0A7L7L4V9_9BACT|nr:hypothetical protein [Adhaeribacter radiodurans]QMU27851.1 hypothetical protein HUW48_07260 [Adhaeribacter radiodurans]